MNSNTQSIDKILENFSKIEGPLLPILHAIQELEGYVPSELVPKISEFLNISRAEIHGVITYYHHFREKPAGKFVIQVCRAEACQSVGSETLSNYVENLLDCKFGSSTKDGLFTLEPVYCLGQCACGPAIMINDDVFGKVTKKKFENLLNKVKDDL
tara:strand:- start:474 stop:941 length:468 start_codon:yes stop_codon:yes gene_type:complete